MQWQRYRTWLFVWSITEFQQVEVLEELSKPSPWLYLWFQCLLVVALVVDIQRYGEIDFLKSADLKFGSPFVPLSLILYVYFILNPYLVKRICWIEIQTVEVTQESRTIRLPTIHSPKFILRSESLAESTSNCQLWTLLIKYRAVNGLPGGVTYFFDDQDVLVADKNLKLTLIGWLLLLFCLLFAWRSL